MRARGSFVLVISLVTTLGAAPSAWGGKNTTIRYWLDTGTVRGAAGFDALLHDGSPVYPGSSVVSYLADAATTDSNGFQDFFYFHADSKNGGRSIAIQDVAFNSGQPLPCRIGKVILKSSRAPDWSHIGVGATVASDGVLQCYVNTRYDGYIIGYPDGAAECLMITRVSQKQWRFEAPSTCDSAVWRSDRNTPTSVRPFNSAGIGVPFPAEFELTATFK